jgi:hypothetical protein
MTMTVKLLSSSLYVTAAAPLLWLSLSMGAYAQSAEVSQTASTTAIVIPQQVRYAGALPSRAGGTVEAVFKIYATAEGGEPLWTETQQVAVGADGTYTVLLGAATEKGLPQGVFAAGQARWVGVSVDRGEEQSRSPLASVAYAMKAGDAESVGGLAAATLATKSDLAKLSQAVATVVQAQPQFQPEVTPTGSGTPNYVPLWTASGTLGNSGIYQAASGFVGIGTATPGGPLQLSTGAQGGANATMMLTQTNAGSGNYYADLGLYNSKGLIGNLSALGAGYPAGNLYGANDVVFLGGQQNAGTNLIMLTNTSGALKFGTGGYAIANERLRIGAAGGVSLGNSYVATDPGAGNLIVSGKVGVGTKTPAAVLEVNGTAKFDGLVSFASGQTFPGAGTGTITGITTTSPLAGSGTSGSVALSLNTSALETTLNGKYAQLGANNTFADYVNFNSGIGVDLASGSSYAAVNAVGTKGTTGVYGSSDTGYGLEGVSASGKGVVGQVTAPAGGSSGVLGYVGSAFSATYSIVSMFDAGVSADAVADGSSANAVAGLLATTDDAYGALVANASTTYPALFVDNFDGPGVYAFSGHTGNALVAQANEGYAGDFENVSNDLTTLYVQNFGSGGLGTAVKGTGSTGLFDTLTATSATGTCGIGGGSMSCTGPMKSLVSTAGSRTVETYAPQSAENWMEDYGTGAMNHGVGVVQLDSTFADTVTADASYHVFLTPRGDSPGHLYVTNVTAGSFEVRESGSGTSSISFDYKIVGKRRGYEAQRMVDVTEAFTREMAKGQAAKEEHAKRTLLGKRRPGQVPSASHGMIVPSSTPMTISPQAVPAAANLAASK